MDKKTFEYMKERTKKYEALQEEIGRLLEVKQTIQKYGGVGIRTNKGTNTFNIKTSEKLEKTLDNFIDDRLSEIEKEMEEI